MYKIIKRVIDFIGGLIGVLLMIPISFIIQVAFWCSGDWHRIFYRQRRVGKDGKIIKIYKFRTMVKHADRMLDELLEDEDFRKEWEEDQKVENDPRITPVGRYLRKYSIDEIPQAINVLIGNMSLVGPRPLVEGELEAHGGDPIYWQVKPGITGWWACHGRSNVDYKTRLEMEYFYVRKCSLKLDAICLYKTFFGGATYKGAI